jgi:hypothetical protein
VARDNRRGIPGGDDFFEKAMGFGIMPQAAQESFTAMPVATTRLSSGGGSLDPADRIENTSSFDGVG